MKAYDLEARLIDFAVSCIQTSYKIKKDTSGLHLSGQLIRSGSSPALNYGEAQSAESRKDFIHKMKISLKELRESFVCIKIIQRVGLTKNEKLLISLGNECNELISIFVTSIKTAEKRK